MKGACSSPTTENFPQLSCHYECPISGLQSKWSVRADILNLFARHVKTETCGTGMWSLLVIGKTILYLPWSLYHIIMIITIGYMRRPGKWLLLIIGYWQHPISRTIHAAQRKTCNKLETCLRESRKTNLAKAHIIMIFLFLRISSRGRTSAGTLHLNNRMSSIGYSLDMAYSEYTRF